MQHLKELTLATAIALATGTAANAQAPALPKSPIALNVIDVAGNLALTQKAMEKYRADNPKLVSRITFSKAPSPELPAKIKAQQNAKRVDIDLVLTGSDALAAGIEQGLWEQVVPKHAASLPKLEDVYPASVQKLQALAQGYGVTVAYSPGGPLIEFMPDRVKSPPTSAAELLAWCKANPNRFVYARPANSGPGRAFLMGLPYILGDSDPKDPIKGWDKTWAYLKDMNSCIEYYPTGTGPTFKELGEGSRDIVTTMTGWDINPRVLGTVPKTAKIQALAGFHFVADAHYMAIPAGIAPDHLAVVLDLVKYMLTPEAQAFTYDEGYFYPGPAVKDVPLSMAPKASQDAIAEYGRPEYAKLIAETPVETPLDAKAMVAAFRKWDEDVGAAKTK
jgi:putative spermidine/putrescine transport system substrate-binding protein